MGNPQWVKGKMGDADGRIQEIEKDNFGHVYLKGWFVGYGNQNTTFIMDMDTLYTSDFINGTTHRSIFISKLNQPEVIDHTNLRNSDPQLNFEVFPNPCVEKVQFNPIQNNDQIAIYDLLGNNVMNKVRQFSENGSCKIIVSSLQPGLYFAHIRRGNSTVTKKLVKK
jgi:hypothetical protein